MIEIKGALSALVTPFTPQGDLDLQAMGRLIDYQIGSGIDGLVVCGTTGEKATLSREEYFRVAQYCVRRIGGRVPALLGTGSNSTQEAMAQDRLAAELGYDAVLSVCPYYNKPNQRGLLAHFTAIAEASSLPIVLYNVPGRTAVNMTASTAVALSALPGIVAIKEASGDLQQGMEIIVGAPKINLLAGDDALALALMALGAKGVVSVAGNQIPGAMAELISAVALGDLGRARGLHYRYQGLFQANFIESNPVPAKYVLARMGLISDAVRLPLVPLSEASKKVLDGLIEELGLRSP